LDVLKTCDGTDGRDAKSGSTSTAHSGSAVWDDDVMVNCAALEEGVKSVVASANRGGARISDEVLLNHELLQYARQGNLRGVSEALDKGAWTETRRPLVMKPQKPDTGKKGTGDDPAVIGMTPIMFAAQKGSAECVQRLLQARAEVNAVEEDGWSALHFASKEGHLQVCQSLLECKADPALMNIDEQRPVDVADEDMSFKERFTKICKAMPVFLRGSIKPSLAARQRRLQDAELEATREETQVQLRLTAFREEVLQEKKRQAFLQAALERAQAGGQAMRIASTMTSQRQEVVVGAQNQLLAGKALLSSLLREYQGRQMQEAKVSHPADSNQSGPDDDLRALQAELREIQLEMAAEQARATRINQQTEVLETEKRSLQAKSRSADAMSELQMQIQELAVGDPEVGGRWHD
ncbi:caskin2, partial [Symbiodinium microadriaticum]